MFEISYNLHYRFQIPSIQFREQALYNFTFFQLSSVIVTEDTYASVNALRILADVMPAAAAASD